MTRSTGPARVLLFRRRALEDFDRLLDEFRWEPAAILGGLRSPLNRALDWLRESPEAGTQVARLRGRLDGVRVSPVPDFPGISVFYVASSSTIEDIRILPDDPGRRSRWTVAR